MTFPFPAVPPASIATPDEIATLWGWWAPDSMNGTTTLTSWTDKSGNGRTLTPQGSNPGKGTSGPNGYAHVDIDTASVDGAERLESGDVNAALTTVHAFAVMRIDSYINQKMVLQSTNDDAKSTQNLIYSTSDRLECKTHDGGAKTATWSAAEPTAGSWALVESFIEDGVSCGIAVDNGTPVTTAIGSVSTSGDFDEPTLGANGFGSDAVDTSWSELIIYPAKLSAPQKQQVIDYFVAKYGAIGSW